MSWKFTRKLMPVRFEIDEPVCMIVPQRRGELEEFAPELRPIESDEDLRRKYEFFLRSRHEMGQVQATTDTTTESVPWEGDYARGKALTARPGGQIIRLAVTFVRFFSHPTRTAPRFRVGPGPCVRDTTG